MKSDQENKNVPSADAEVDLEKDGDKVTGGVAGLAVGIGVVISEGTIATLPAPVDDEKGT